MELVVEKTSSNDLMEEAERLGRILSATQGSLLTVVGELDRRQAYRAEGATSVAAWMTQRLGVAEGTGRSWALVAEKLWDLPHLAQGLRVGALSFDKVRAAVELATPESDASVLRQAEECTVRQLIDLIRARRGTNDEQAAARHDYRYLRFNDARRLMTAQLTDDAYAEVRGAITARARMFPSDGETAFDQRRADGLLDICRGSSVRGGTGAGAGARADGDAGGDGDGGAGARADGDAGRDGDAEGSVSGDADAGGRASGDADADADGGGRVGASGGGATGTGAGGGAGAGAGAGAGGTAGTGGGGAGGSGATSASGARWRSNFFVVAHTDLSFLRGGSGGAEIEGLGLLSREAIRRISCSATVALALDDAFGHTMFEGRARRFASDAQRREVQRRDRRCRFPGCSNNTFTDVHHIVHWIDQGTTDLPNLVLLCDHHHHRVHEGKWEMTGNANGILRFVGPNGRPMTSRPSPVWTRRRD
jgi:hypothetical protein